MVRNVRFKVDAHSMESIKKNIQQTGTNWSPKGAKSELKGDQNAATNKNMSSGEL